MITPRSLFNVAVDVVAQPKCTQMSISTAIYEGLLNMKHGHKVIGMAAEARSDAPCAEIFKR